LLPISGGSRVAALAAGEETSSLRTEHYAAVFLVRLDPLLRVTARLQKNFLRKNGNKILSAMQTVYANHRRIYNSYIRINVTRLAVTSLLSYQICQQHGGKVN
jgi:hypothetical protein